MTSVPARTRRHAFALVELAAVVLVLTLVLAVLVPLACRSRRAAGLGHDFQKLRQISAGTFSYTTDNQDLVWSFSWQSGVQNPLGTPATDRDAAAQQAVHIMRQRTGDDDIALPPNWIPHIYYSHLVLVDYLQAPLPWLTAVSSADADRLRWTSDPQCFMQGCYLPCQPSPHHQNQRWLYSGSFMLTPAWWDRSSVGSRVFEHSTCSQGGCSSTYFVPPAHDFGGARLADAAFPSQKVLVHDEFARHFGPRDTYFAHPAARLPLLMADGAVHLRATAAANPGWQPNEPTSPEPTTVSAWTIGACTPGDDRMPAPQDVVRTPGVYRWTRGGIAGIDFNGSEIDTGQHRSGADSPVPTPKGPPTRSLDRESRAQP